MNLGVVGSSTTLSVFITRNFNFGDGMSECPYLSRPAVEVESPS